MIRWIIRVLSLAFVLFSLSYYPLLPAGKSISVVYHLKGSITENKTLDDSTRKELLELAVEALVEVTERNTRIDDQGRYFSYSGAIFGLVMFFLSFGIKKHNQKLQNIQEKDTPEFLN